MDADPLITESERETAERKHAAPPAPSPAESHRRTRASAYAQIVVAILAVLAACYVARLVIIVLLISILLSYVLAPVVEVLERLRLRKAFASAIAVLLFCGVLYLLGNLFYNQAVAFSRELPKYSGKIKEVVGRVHRQARQIQQTTENVLPDEAGTQTIKVQQQSWLDHLTSNLGSVTQILFIASFIPFLIYFMLSWQDHVRSATVMLFEMRHRNTAYVTLGQISGMIRSFILGNLLLGLFLGGISTVIFAILQLPYSYFVGFASGFLSLVPYLGVVLAIFPPLVAGLGHIHSTQFIVIVASVIGLHLFAINVLYPKFLGSRLQLNPLAVTISLMFWGWLWGAVGLILAVPLTAALKIICDHVEPLRGYAAWLGE